MNNIENPNNYQDTENREEISKKDKEMLLILNELHFSFAEKGINNFVVGGWAVEGHGGPKTKREHHDIDYLVWRKDKGKLEELLRKENFEVIKGEYNENGKLQEQEFEYKIVGNKNGVDIDFGFIEIDEKTGDIYPCLFPEFHFPKEFLDGGETSLKSENDKLSKFNVATKELLLAMKIKSERTEDQKDTEFLKKEIGDEQKIREIAENYALDYKRFKEITPCGLPASGCHRVTMKGKFENRRFSF